jgi:N-acetylmuramoyl-L-alanine amidase
LKSERYQKLADEILFWSAWLIHLHEILEKFSGILNEILSKILLWLRGVKQAGFYVLVGASMPGVLIESGFLSDAEDAKYLKSEKGQTGIAEAIFNAIKKYKEDYETILQSGL